MTNYRMADSEYFSEPRPVFKDFDLDKAITFMDHHLKINSASWWHRKVVEFSDKKKY